MAQTPDKGSHDPAWTVHNRGERQGDTPKHKALGTAEKCLPVPVFWGRQLVARLCLKLFLLGKLEFKGNVYAFLTAKTDKHSRTEAWKPTVFAGLGFSSLFSKGNKQGHGCGQGRKCFEEG